MRNALKVPDVARKHQPITLEVLDDFPELKKWLRQISRCEQFKPKETNFVFISDYKEKESIGLQIFTKDHQYFIKARLPNVKKPVKGEMLSVDGYLGCMVKTRKPRAGEDWNRGRDLADGKYCQETWRKIVNDILAFELVKVVRNSN